MDPKTPMGFKSWTFTEQKLDSTLSVVLPSILFTQEE